MSNGRTRRRIAPWLGLALVVACESNLPTPNDSPLTTLCDANLTVMVKGSSAPDFSWSPNCRVVRLLVETSSSGDDRWVVVAAGGFNAPVHYGTTPAGATVVTAPQSLAAGTSHHVVLFRDVNEAQLVGIGAFTP